MRWQEEGNPENEYDSTAARFDAIMDHHDANFCGREDFVANLTDVAATTQAKAIMLTSHYGLGKTALLSHWYRQLCKDDRFLPYIYFANRQATATSQESPTPTSSEPMLEFDFDDEAKHSRSEKNADQTVNSNNSVKRTRLENKENEVKSIDIVKRRVIEIRVYYDDYTFETFVPDKR